VKKRMFLVSFLVLALCAVAAFPAGAQEGYHPCDLNWDGSVNGEDLVRIEAVAALRGAGVRTPEVTGGESPEWPFRIVDIDDFALYKDSVVEGSYRPDLDWYPDGVLDGEGGLDMEVFKASFGLQNPDVTGDGWVDSADVGAVRVAAGLWVPEDLNWDGMVNQADVDIISHLLEYSGTYGYLNTPEVSGDKVVDIDDFAVFKPVYTGGEYREDLDWYPDGVLDEVRDIEVLRRAFGRQNPDVTGNGRIDWEDLAAVVAAFS